MKKSFFPEGSEYKGLKIAFAGFLIALVGVLICCLGFLINQKYLKIAGWGIGLIGCGVAVVGVFYGWVKTGGNAIVNGFDLYRKLSNKVIEQIKKR